MKNTTLEWLQEWQCDRFYKADGLVGFVLETLDNPGWTWKVIIPPAVLTFPPNLPKEVERTLKGWIQYSINVDFKGMIWFSAACGAENLVETLRGYKDWWFATVEGRGGDFTETHEWPAPDVATRYVPKEVSSCESSLHSLSEEGVLTWLQSWYARQCDGDWEHSYGITLKTTEHTPGWVFQVDLALTAFEERPIPSRRIVRSESDWIEVCNEPDSERSPRFTVTGGLRNLVEMLECFRDWVEEAEVDSGVDPDG